ncbi:hypothetical protein U0E10_08585 [Burkholderia ubonensis]|uniref:hypothetical protein n=1 Tax=Burkholderia ubonensis TaxID=101571 RepID=UPI002AB476E7|nr:hypothetical protein [Burkholderia ubonensis]MDY7787965.1 hypothetical protein [Burkholderia ubonensis]
MTLRKRASEVHFEVNVCGGGFDVVGSRFLEWKQEPLISRPNRRMFEGKTDVRRLTDRTFDSTEAARRALEHASRPQDDFALAAPVNEEGRAFWIVLAAYEA